MLFLSLPPLGDNLGFYYIDFRVNFLSLFLQKSKKWKKFLFLDHSKKNMLKNLGANNLSQMMREVGEGIV